ncbi:hypothetical protein QYE76_014694 [Lolium multiflorum]|uniref:Uncharacterized protein n=1 Tax=Lolium multiflorum TaxID=4521 RepID=A0AAD8X8E9_LOLMU|nr:hypothetical protein QYE76_014694 [Lolium multiflorum]
MDTVKSTPAVPTHEVVHTAEVDQPVTFRERTYTITHIPEACRLAEELMKLGEEARWKVIRGVWVEMLCYSASRCRGYLHAKSLGEGREYLTTVWLLWAFLGMETLASMIQSPEPTEKEDINYDDDDEEEEGEEEEEEEEKKKEGASTSQVQGQADQPVEMCPV